MVGNITHGKGRKIGNFCFGSLSYKTYKLIKEKFENSTVLVGERKIFETFSKICKAPRHAFPRAFSVEQKQISNNGFIKKRLKKQLSILSQHTIKRNVSP